MGIKQCMALLLAAAFCLLCACAKDDLSSSVSVEADVASSFAQEASAAAFSLPPLDPMPQAAVGTSVLTGLPLAAELPEGQRPIAINVSNSWRARPQRGLAVADVLVEMVARGNDTHFLALYTGDVPLSTTGPVNDTYDQFVQFALPLNAVQVHIDASPYAENLLQYTNTPTVDGIELGRIAFAFDYARTTPRAGAGKLSDYCWFTDTAFIAEGMNTAQIPATGTVAPLFRFGTPAAGGAAAGQLAARYTDDIETSFSYVAEADLYYKYVQGNLQTDEDGAFLGFSNVFFLSANLSYKADSDRYWEYDFSTGSGWYFTGGHMQPITWIKGEPASPLRLLDKNNNELAVKAGKSYVGFVPGHLAEQVSWA